MLKPDVVFFGENVPAPGSSAATPRSTRWPAATARCWSPARSLTVMSGFRFVRRAAKAGIPVVIVNRGPTRGDDLATYRWTRAAAEFLTAVGRAAQLDQAALQTS